MDLHPERPAAQFAGGDAASERVDAVETHISVLFFAHDRVYKFLKPISTGFLDHTPLDRRLAAVTAECELNRRIAPDVYLGTSDLYEHGELVDRLLIMRRLPTDRRLSGLVDELDFGDHLRRIAHAVATFHSSTPPVFERSTMTTASGLLSLWESSFDEIAPAVDTVIDRTEFENVTFLAREYLNHSESLFDHRRSLGLMRDGHGDLTADDIFMLDDGPRILDCIAFDDRYRISDVLADIAFLVMDVERLAGPDRARQLLAYYCEFVGEHHPASLAHHYVAYRAHVRAKVALIRHRQGDDGSAEIAVRRHRQTLDHLSRARRRVVLVGGGPGSGKSTLAGGLADRFNWAVIDSDTLRKDLAAVDHDDHRVAAHPELYGDAATAATYAGLIAHADATLAAGESVIVDATWGDSSHRAKARDLAARHGAVLVELECRLDPAEARNRIAERQRVGDDPSDASPELVDHMARRFHPWPSASVVDSSVPVDAMIAAAATAIAHRSALTI